MPKVIFIRHAEPDKNDDITEEGAALAAKITLPDARKFCSKLPRSYKTLLSMKNHGPYLLLKCFNEWDKNKETEDDFKNRVEENLSTLLNNGDVVIVSHSRWMNWAYWLLKGKPTLGFDYLEGFEHEF